MLRLHEASLWEKYEKMLTKQKMVEMLENFQNE
jgi:hypothetical protein